MNSSYERMQYRIYDSLQFICNREINLRDDEIARLKEELAKLKSEIETYDEKFTNESVMQKELNNLKNKLLSLKNNHQIQVSQLSIEHQNQLQKLSQLQQEHINQSSKSETEVSDFTEAFSNLIYNSSSEENELQNKITELKRSIQIEKSKTRQLKSIVKQSVNPIPNQFITPELLMSLPKDQKLYIVNSLQSQNKALKREICRLDSMIYGRHGKYQKWKNI